MGRRGKYRRNGKINISSEGKRISYRTWYPRPNNVWKSECRYSARVNPKKEKRRYADF